MTEAKGKLIFDKRFFKENEGLLGKYFNGLTNARKNKKHSENTIGVVPTNEQNSFAYLFEANTYDNMLESLPELLIPLCLIAEKVSAENFDEVENFVKVFQRLIDSKTGIKVEWVEEETMLYCDDTFTVGTATIIPNAGKKGKLFTVENVKTQEHTATERNRIELEGEKGYLLDKKEDFDRLVKRLETLYPSLPVPIKRRYLVNEMDKLAKLLKDYVDEYPTFDEVDIDEKLRYNYQGALSDWRLIDDEWDGGLYQRAIEAAVKRELKKNKINVVPDSPLDDAIKGAKKVRGLAAASNTDSQKSEKTH